MMSVIRSHGPAKQHFWPEVLTAVAVIAGLVLYYVSAFENGADKIPLGANPTTPADPGQAAAETWSPSSAIDIEGQTAVNDKEEGYSLYVFDSLLAKGEYAAAVDLYDRIYIQHSTDVSRLYRELLVARASSLIQTREPGQAVALLNQYLSIYYTDVEALVMLGRAQRDAGSLFDAIRSFQQAYRHEHRTSVAALILGQENTAIGEYVQELKENDDRGRIIELYQWLTAAQPGVAGFYIGLAQAYTAERRYAEATRALRYVQNDVQVGAQARAMLDDLAKASAPGSG